MKIFSTFQAIEVGSTGTLVERLVNEVGYFNSRQNTLVFAFRLPDLKGAGIDSLTLSFLVESFFFTPEYDLDLYGIRSETTFTDVETSDYNGGTLLEASIADKDTTAPFTASLTDDTAFVSWLTTQYASVGVGGYVFLRLELSDKSSTVDGSFQIKTNTIDFNLLTDGSEDAQSGTGTTVTAQMGAHEFTWEFDTAVNWGRFMDGMPWITLIGATNLIAVTPTRLNSQTVYKHPSTTASPVAVSTPADINITVKNPIVGSVYDPGGYSSPDTFGWDSREPGANGSGHPIYDASLGWDGSTPMPVVANDIITSAKSMTTADMINRACILEALATLTVLGATPASDAFRPSPLSGGTVFELLEYSSLIDLSGNLITDPSGVVTSLDGTVIGEPSQVYMYDWAGQQLGGPGFLCMDGSVTEGCSAIVNNSLDVDGIRADSNYGGTVGNSKLTPLAVGCVADWFTANEREACQKLYIQRAIDTYGALEQGLTLKAGGGIEPGYAPLVITAGIMMNHSGMSSVDDGINGVDPWWIFSDYGMTYHTGVGASNLVDGEDEDTRKIALYYASGDMPQMNKEDAQDIISSTSNTATFDDTFFWGDQRPMHDVINVKMRIKSGTGASDQIYTIIEAEGFLNDSGTPCGAGLHCYSYRWGGTVTVSPPFTSGNPDATSVIDLSVTTSNTHTTTSDDNTYGFFAEGINAVGIPFIDKEVGVNFSPIAPYADIFLGGSLGGLILLYALDGEDLYHGLIDKYMIAVGERVGYGEVVFNSGSYLNALSDFKGALYKQEILNKVGSTFIYTGGSYESLAVPSSTSYLWNERAAIVVTTYHPGNTWNNSNNKYKYPEVQSLIDADALQNLAGDGPVMFDGSGNALTFTQAELAALPEMNNNKQLYGCFEVGGTGLAQYENTNTDPHDAEVQIHFSCL